MARIIRPSWAIRCQTSNCRGLFEVAVITQKGISQEVVCPGCGEHYLYPPPDFYDGVDGQKMEVAFKNNPQQ